jgi:dTDP-4-amino-4,6-dideoxygalactose transaminase
MNIPMTGLRPQLEATASAWQANLDRLFLRGHFILGEEVAAFEREFAEYLGASWTAGVGSGTAALELCLRAAGLSRGRREVITSVLTSPFTAQAIVAAGGTPRFADVDPRTLLIDADDACGRANRATAAIVPVHLYGQPCELRRLADATAKLGIALVQDACQAHGARFGGQPFTHYSPWVAYSFYPTKNLGCLGDGGAVVTDSRSTLEQVLLLRDGGRRGDQLSRVKAVHSRLDEMQACYLRAFLPRLDDWNARREKLAAFYDESLAGCEYVQPMRRSDDSVNHLYVVRAQRRDELRSYLLELGITTGVHYPVPLHLHPAFHDCGAKKGSFPHAEQACSEILSLPLWPYMADSDVLKVAEVTRGFYRRGAARLTASPAHREPPGSRRRAGLRVRRP